MGCFLILSTITEDEITSNTHVLLLIVTSFLGFFYFIFEVRQFIYRPMPYITSPWNWSDLAAILFPTITSIIWLYNIFPPVWIITISVFLLEIRFLLFFCVLENFGTYFAIMIGVAQKIFSFLVILGILVLAFAHSLHILLRPSTKYSYNQPNYTNDSNNPWNLVSTYQFISSNGDSSAVSSWVYKNNWMLVFLIVIFSFFTTIYLLNLFISLLGDAVKETNNEESFLQLKCELPLHSGLAKWVSIVPVPWLLPRLQWDLNSRPAAWGDNQTT
ncbi:hypothetical protein C2G38_2180752 [Gigaspora rosea]|uniref:Ion transport domain-containing protein n=1 Tax=Gigaspora rosea TaxID=44941 RepID=A0A397VBJ8_9GLOM|nr:hypothetical protein C2G38_2180752 [Gigaspora rosea]